MLDPTLSPTNLLALDQHKFGRLAEAHRRELRVHCYRMLGSVQEAEEMVQETLWRAWNRRDTFAGRAPFRAWLYKIATNACLDELRKKPRRGLPVSRGGASRPDLPIPAALQEPVWLEPYPYDLPAPEENNPEARYTQSESIRLAFMAALHLLPPRQRAVLILRDVLGWSADETASALGQTVTAVKSALYRARTTLAEHRPTLRQEDLPARVSDEALRTLLERYVRAWEAADVDGLVALLREDSTFSMPPTPSWYRGREAIGALVARTIFSGQAAGRWRLLPARANDQPAFGLYRVDEGSSAYLAYGIQVLLVAGGQVLDVTTFRRPELAPFFGLPERLAG